MTEPNVPAPFPRWSLHAALAGILACGLGALIGTSRYVALPGALGLDWTRMPLAIGLFVLVAGLSVGLGIGAATRFAARRGARLPGFMVAGACGGIVAGIAPGLLGIAGFGSLHAPYAGTANILGSTLIAAIAFVALWSPQLFPGRREISALHQLGHATLASVVSLGALGMMTWSLLLALDVVPSFDAIAELAESVGLVSFAIVVGALTTAFGGAAIGAACALVGRTSR